MLVNSDDPPLDRYAGDPQDSGLCARTIYREQSARIPSYPVYNFRLLARERMNPSDWNSHPRCREALRGHRRAGSSKGCQTQAAVPRVQQWRQGHLARSDADSADRQDPGLPTDNPAGSR